MDRKEAGKLGGEARGRNQQARDAYFLKPSHCQTCKAVLKFKDRGENKLCFECLPKVVLCETCGKSLSRRGLKYHMWRTHGDGISLVSGRGPGVPSWNKGLTKETSEALVRQGESYRARLASGEIHVWSEGLTSEMNSKVREAGRKISETLNRKVAEGTWHNSFSRSRCHEYRSVRFYGMWEVGFAKYLDALQEDWRRPVESHPYFFEGKSRRYTPDFYLEGEQLYVEIKGYPTPKDLAKWVAFPYRLRILFGRHLLGLGVIESYKKIRKFNEACLQDLGFSDSPLGWERGPLIDRGMSSKG